MSYAPAGYDLSSDSDEDFYYGEVQSYVKPTHEQSASAVEEACKSLPQKPLPSQGEDLRAAVAHGDAKSVQSIIEGGYPVDGLLPCGWTALTLAAHLGHGDLVHLLVVKGADANWNLEGFSPLMAGCSAELSEKNREGVIHSVRLLIAAGANVNTYDRYRNTALMYSAKRGLPEAISLLLQHGADVHAEDEDGLTSLCLAAAAGGGGKAALEAVRALAGGGATGKREDRVRAARIAENSGNTEIVELLENLDSCLTGEISTPTSGLRKLVRSRMFLGKEKGSEVDLMLHGVGLGHLCDLFEQHRVTWDTFLSITDEQLIQMGVSQVGDRDTLVKAIRSVHKQEWEERSVNTGKLNRLNESKGGVEVPMKMGPVAGRVTCADATAMVANMATHTQYMISCTKYLLGRLASKQLSLEPGNYGTETSRLLMYCGQMSENTEKLLKDARAVETVFEQTVKDAAGTTAPDLKHRLTTGCSSQWKAVAALSTATCLAASGTLWFIIRRKVGSPLRW